MGVHSGYTDDEVTNIDFVAFLDDDGSRDFAAVDIGAVRTFEVDDN